MTEHIKPLDWSQAASDIPASGRSFSREATAAERAAIAKVLDLLECIRLSASYKIRPIGAERYRLDGMLVAEVSQACVVSLEPVPASLALPLGVDFCSEEPSPETSAEAEAEVSALPDIALIGNGRLEVGDVIFDTLSAGLDPFPRAAGKSLGWTDPKQRDDKPNPFAVLQKLKEKPGR